MDGYEAGGYIVRSVEIVQILLAKKHQVLVLPWLSRKLWNGGFGGE